MRELFTADFFRGNRKQLRALLTKSVPVILTANGQLQRSVDTAYPFQQDTYFWYLTGIAEPDVILVLDKDEEYLILPQRSAYQDAFDGRVDKKALATQSGVHEIYNYKEGWTKLTGRLRHAKQVATITPPPQYLETYGMYSNPARWVLRRSILQENEAIELLDLRKPLATLRMIKQTPELTAIKRAISITTQGFSEVTRAANLKKYSYEYEVEADLARAFQRAKSGHAFQPIIAGGKRACTLHNTDLQGKITSNELLLFDIGAAYHGYAADISRTIAIDSPSKRQREVYDAVREVQISAFSLLKPGVILAEYEKQIEQIMGEKLKELGLIKVINTESVRKFYPHATSHHLGLDVHDADDRASPLEPDMVITVEPGIYIPSESIGVRIEDDIRITNEGVEILSGSLSSELD